MQAGASEPDRKTYLSVKLNIVPARTGIQWVKLGLQTFFRQPFALAGLFLLYFMAMTLLGLIPLLGTGAALILAPAATLGIMAAAREAAEGRFPLPTLLVTAFRGGPQRTRAMLTLGAIYAVALLAALMLASLFGGPATPAPAPADPNALPKPELTPALAILAVLQLPLLVLFAHAPALVYWHGLTPVKALFFALVAFWRNIGAFLAFVAAWMGVVLVLLLVLGLVLQLLGTGMSMATAFPMVLLIGTVGTCSLYFSYRDSYVAPGGEEPPAPPAPEEETP